MKKSILFVMTLLALIILSNSITVVSAAGGTSPYITPEPTSYNLDIVGIFGAVIYGIGVVFATYGKVFYDFVSRQA
jgi:hypothetical protein